MQGLHDQRAHVTYRRLLTRNGHGYPLWIPEPDDNLVEEYRQHGVSIGDVGLLTADGGFDYIFNVHANADHPVNLGRVPRDFVPLPLCQLGPHPIRLSLAMFPTQTSITSAEVKTRSFSVDASAEAPGLAGGGFELEFSTSRTQAAILTLPTGASRQNAANLSLYGNYAAQHGKSWYRHVNGELGRCATNGTLYLVTGCDKTDSWGTAAFCHQPEHATEVSLKFLATGVGQGSLSSTSTWNTTMGVETRRFPSPGATALTGCQNQCVFTRGFSIALRDNLIKRKVRGSIRISHISGAPSDVYPTFEGGVPYGSSSSSQPPSPPSSTSPTSSNSKTRSLSQLSGESTSDSEAQDDTADDSDDAFAESEILSPSCLLSRYVLDMCPEADVALVHDEDWLHLLQAETIEDDNSDVAIILRSMRPGAVVNGIGSLTQNIVATQLSVYPPGFQAHEEETSILSTLPNDDYINPHKDFEMKDLTSDDSPHFSLASNKFRDSMAYTQPPGKPERSTLKARQEVTRGSDSYNMTNPGYSSYSYPVDPSATAYYQQPVPRNNGSVSPDGNYATSYTNSAAPRTLISPFRTRRSPEVVGMDDPTQPRRYVTASTTLRKEVRGYWQPLHRAPSIPSDEEDELMEEPPAANATDSKKIEYKRRPDLLAARRSRRRKRQYTHNPAETARKLRPEGETVSVEEARLS